MSTNVFTFGPDWAFSVAYPMNYPLPFLFVSIMMAAAFAGCVGDEDAVDAGNGIRDAPEEAKVTATKGSIMGTLASDLFEPLAGALVTLVESGQEATVARNGEFVVNDVEPGRHTVQFTAKGYQSVTRPVEVTAGTVTRVDVQLVPVPSDDPYIQSYESAGLVRSIAWQVEPPVVGCIVAPEGIAKTCSGSGSGTNTEVAVNVTADVETILVELAWDPAGPLGEHLQLDFMCEDAPRGANGAVLDTAHPCYYQAPGSTTPLLIRADRQDSVDGSYKWTGDWAARVFAGYGLLGTYDLTGIDVGYAHEQKFTMYISLFHRQAAPDGYSAIPDQ